MDWIIALLIFFAPVALGSVFPQGYGLIEAVSFSYERNVSIGEVVGLDKGKTAFGIGTGAGLLGVLKVQIEGKRAMPATEFLRGQREFVGAVLPN